MPKKRRVVAALWERYRTLVIPKTASEVQLTESRRAFYAGAKSILDAMGEGLSDAPETTAEDEAVVGQLADEFHEFYELIKMGKA